MPKTKTLHHFLPGGTIVTEKRTGLKSYDKVTYQKTRDGLVEAKALAKLRAAKVTVLPNAPSIAEKELVDYLNSPAVGTSLTSVGGGFLPSFPGQPDSSGGGGFSMNSPMILGIAAVGIFLLLRR